MRLDTLRAPRLGLYAEQFKKPHLYSVHFPIITKRKAPPFRAGCRFIKVFRGAYGVRRAVAVEIESPPPELYAVEEPYRRVVEKVAGYVAERGTLEKCNELYRRFRGLYLHLPTQGADEDETRTSPHVATALGEEIRKTSLGSSIFNSNTTPLRR